MTNALKGIRPLDYVLAALMTAAGVYLMYENITVADPQSLPHPLSTTTATMLPFFLAVTVPILWRRRNILAVIGVTAVATVVHVVMFGWVTRCGVLVPLSVALAYAVARFAHGRRDHLIGLTGILLLQVVTVARDSSIDTMIGALPLTIAAGALCYGIGRIVQARVAKNQARVSEEQPAAVTV
jgi:hypothetical protein